jgi:hypothetical protein
MKTRIRERKSWDIQSNLEILEKKYLKYELAKSEKVLGKNELWIKMLLQNTNTNIFIFSQAYTKIKLHLSTRYKLTSLQSQSKTGPVCVCWALGIVCPYVGMVGSKWFLTV